jgi:hypothetical protein
MNAYQRRLMLLVVVGLLGLSGASCPRMMQRTPALPRVLPPAAPLEQVIQAVNQNSQQIQSFSTNTATLSGPGWPTLRANIAFQRQRMFRLRAETGLTGPELDVGSNDQLFWFWVRRNQPPAVYFCRHEQFATSRARQMIPIEPDWLIDALGASGFDPALPHQGPYPSGGDRVSIRTIRETPEGPTTKVTVVDAVRAVVLEQHLYDAQGRLRASAVAAGHRRDPLSGLVLPATIHINCPVAQFKMRIDLGSVQVNQLTGNPAELWSMPSYAGSPPTDLSDPNLQLAPAPASAPPPAVSERPLPPHSRGFQRM